MGFKIVELENSWKIGYKLDNIIVNYKEFVIPILISEIDVLLVNNQLSVSVRLLSELSKHNVLVIICDEKHIPSTLIVPISGHYNSLKILEKQMQWTDKYKFEKWRDIIKLKIFFEDQIIDFLKLDKIDNVNYNYDSFVSVQGAEALHARMLFERLFGKKFIRFDEENDENRFINSTLNYGFSIILSAFCRSIVKNGYDTRISLFHKSFSNHFALASDLMEPFRILITFYTYKVIRKLKKEHLILSSEIKTQLIKILEEDMYYNNERIRISIGIDKYVFDILNDKEFKIEFIYDIN